MPIHIPEQIHNKSSISGSGDTLFLKGEIDDVDPGVFLTQFFELAKEQMDQRIKINFTDLEFLNSSGIKCIVSFVMDKKPGSKIVFITDNSKTWQRTSLEVIQSLDEDNISIEE
ncbi:MAG: hypothetical protein K8S18_12625 [Desulfobacula sp.]|nr:hypothetical protein [Desulfobacula sp.]